MEIVNEGILAIMLIGTLMGVLGVDGISKVVKFRTYSDVDQNALDYVHSERTGEMVFFVSYLHLM